MHILIFYTCNWILSTRVDCEKFNNQYPSCEAHEPEKVGDGNCNAEYNNEFCEWDGGES